MDWRALQRTRAAAALVSTAELRPSIRDFTQYLGAGRRTLAIIPLLSRHDPASGPREPVADLARDARALDELEIPALAVATAPEPFARRLDDLRDVAAAVSAPVLRYDCVADEDRLYESRLAGADAVLAPVAVAGDEVRRIVALARAIHVVVVAEVATGAECEAAIAAGAPVIALAAGALALASGVPTRLPLLVQEPLTGPAELARVYGHADAILLDASLLRDDARAARSDDDALVARARTFVDAAAALAP